MSNELMSQSVANYELMEKVIAEGDLSKLTAQERVMYYNKTCESLSLNPLTRPFEYIRLSGKLTLYARKDATEQLRQIRKISIIKLDTQSIDGVYIVKAHARAQDGQEDIGTGVVTIKGLQGEALANAFMKAETKAKRRVTLSICGLGWTDESEVDSIPTAKTARVDHQTGELLDAPVTPPPLAPVDQEDVKKWTEAINNATSSEELKKVYLDAMAAYRGNKDVQGTFVFMKDLKKGDFEEQEKNVAIEYQKQTEGV